MPFLRGLGMTASMIVALGPQNAYLLKQGLLRKTSVFYIAAIYVCVDIALITIGAFGVGSLVARTTTLQLLFSFIAGGFFLIYGGLSIRSAFKPVTNRKAITTNGNDFIKAIVLSIANPGVLFDTIVLVGGLAGQYEDVSQRIIFSAGAATASLIWFATLSILSFGASKYVSGENIWKTLDLGIGILMIGLSLFILADAFETFHSIGWINNG